MMKKQFAWSVRGVTREARVEAKNAARKRRVTTGEWISLALITIADDELVVSPRSLPPVGPSPIAPSVDEKTLEKLGPREKALLALATKRPAPKCRAEREQQAPWSIRGVSQVARVKAARVAAHRRITIGEWVNHAIQVYAGQEMGVEPAPTTQEPVQGYVPELPEKTLRLVETLARHFDATRTSDKPQAIIPDTLREVENIDQERLSGSASEAEEFRFSHTGEPPDKAPDVTPDDYPATIPERPISDTDQIEQKISQLAKQLLGTERRNERRLAALTKVLTTLANRLQLSGDTAMDIDLEGWVEGQVGPAEDATKLSKAETVYWDSIKDSKDPGDYDSYLESFPDGLFASLARRRAAREMVEDSGEPQPSPGASSRPPRRRPPPASSVPKLDYDTLNEWAIENTKRRN